MRATVSALAALLALAACNDSTPSAPRAATSQKVAITISDSGCALAPRSVAAGGVTFDITNSGTDKVDEVYVLQGTKILAEKEGLTAGTSGSVSLTLTAGAYRIRCSGAGPLYQDLTVTGSSTTAVARDAAEQAKAVTEYGAYVKAQVAEQVTKTSVLTDAVRAGDLAAASKAYPGARVNYERIEPVAESFGDIDPAIDARLPDVTGGIPKWTGYHRLEYAIFHEKTVAGMTPIADKLDADVAQLSTLVQAVEYTVPQIANGASELLDEVVASKITGEEESYSHIDLLDFQGNVDGARAAFASLEPALRTRDDALATRIATAFDTVDAALKPYRTGTGPEDFTLYTGLTKAETTALAGVVDGLAEPLSKVAAELVKA